PQRMVVTPPASICRTSRRFCASSSARSGVRHKGGTARTEPAKSSGVTGLVFMSLVPSVHRALERLPVGEEPALAAGMQEDDRLVLPELALADEVDEAGRTLAGIDGVEQDSLLLGEQPDRLDHAVGGNAVATADIVAIGDHLAALDPALDAQLL